MRDPETEMHLSLRFVQGVDQAAREAFLRCTPEKQFRVRTRGGIKKQGLRERSKILMARITAINNCKKAQEEAAAKKAEASAAAAKKVQEAAVKEANNPPLAKAPIGKSAWNVGSAGGLGQYGGYWIRFMRCRCSGRKAIGGRERP